MVDKQGSMLFDWPLDVDMPLPRFDLFRRLIRRGEGWPAEVVLPWMRKNKCRKGSERAVGIPSEFRHFCTS